MTAPVHPGGPQRFRKKPVVIEAMEWDGTDEAAETIGAWINGSPIFDWDADLPVAWDSEQDLLIIVTLEGDMDAQVGDWIIKGVAGEFYPCKPDIFTATYEPADGSTPQAPTVDSVPVPRAEWEALAEAVNRFHSAASIRRRATKLVNAHRAAAGVS